MCIVILTQLLLLLLLLCYRIKRSSTFPQEIGGYYKEFKGCEFWFQIAFLQFESIFVGSVIEDLLESK